MSDAQLRWQCRRGMQELDVLLTRFLEEQYDMAADTEKEAFRRLVELSDPEVSLYLLGGITPPDSAMENIVARMVSQARTGAG